MTHMLQLHPSLPVVVVDRGEGEAIGWFDYGKEDHLLWLVVFDATGEAWLVPNTQIRFVKNYSIGRTLSAADHGKGAAGSIPADRPVLEAALDQIQASWLDSGRLQCTGCGSQPRGKMGAVPFVDSDHLPGCRYIRTRDGLVKSLRQGAPGSPRS